MDKQTILLIDGDLIGFTIAAAAEKRKIDVKHSPSGIVKQFKNRTEFKNLMKSKEKEITSDYVITDIQIPDTPAAVERSINYKLRNLVDLLEADRYEIFVGGKNNFRDTLPLPAPYKGNRDDSIKPVNLSVAVEHLREKFGAATPDGHEADDELSIRAYDILNRGHRAIICTLDKDAYQAEGIEVYNWNDEKLTLIDPLGCIYIDESKVSKPIKGWGLKFFSYQLLYGDDTDNYSPYELSKYSFGSKSAFNVVKDCTTEQEVLEAVVKTYKLFYPEPISYVAHTGEIVNNAYWKFMLDLYFKCAYMKRSPNDPSCSIEFFRKRNVEL